MEIIEITDPHKVYGRQVAADDVSFTLHESELFGLLDRNDAGRSPAHQPLPPRMPPPAHLTDRALHRQISGQLQHFSQSRGNNRLGVNSASPGPRTQPPLFGPNRSEKPTPKSSPAKTLRSALDRAPPTQHPCVNHGTSTPSDLR
ncbi:hypothetical protein [Sphaerisporangium dianthi]|uniref:Uncharacterized protein n=1 Tax=Sphaerisporangium dianthi TaxID=1436120 RepID=A0ABV9CLQ8_9ACTN